LLNEATLKCRLHVRWNQDYKARRANKTAILIRKITILYKKLIIAMLRLRHLTNSKLRDSEIRLIPDYYGLV